jgi:hypothetical protein
VTVQEIKTLSPGEKIQIMQAIWEDMRDHYEESPVPHEVITLLQERQSRVQRGEGRLLDWDQVKSALGRG